jgi:hypothetical protein
VNCQLDERDVAVSSPQLLTPSACSSSSETTRCAGTYVQRCGADSRWQDDPMPCALGCEGGRCLECAPATFLARCDQGRVVSCDGGRIATTPCPEAEFCEDGACVDSCEEGKVQCDGEGGSGRSVCAGGTAYVPAEPCPLGTPVCVSSLARCSVCEPGKARCGAAGGVERCDDSATPG